MARSLPGEEELADLAGELAHNAYIDGILGASAEYSAVIDEVVKRVAQSRHPTTDPGALASAAAIAAARYERAHARVDELEQAAMGTPVRSREIVAAVAAVVMLAAGVTLALPAGQLREIAVGVGIALGALMAVTLRWGEPARRRVRLWFAGRALRRADRARDGLRGKVAARIAKDQARQRWESAERGRLRALYRFHRARGELAVAAATPGRVSAARPRAA
jgi:hypothetical protein